MPAPPHVETLVDRVPRTAPGSKEIGFSVPARYNASAILFDNLMAGAWRTAVTGPAGSAPTASWPPTPAPSAPGSFRWALSAATAC